MKKAFTLAEVLITLGVIGVVAVLTIPTLIQNYRKSVVETKLKRFYTNINQAITLAEVELGDKTLWRPTDTNDFWENYLSKYLKYLKVEDDAHRFKAVYFADGSVVLIDLYKDSVSVNGGHFIFYPNAKYYTKFNNKDFGMTCFPFAFWPNEPNSHFKYHKNKGVEPYKAWWNGTPKSLYTDGTYGCSTTGRRFFCTALIQLNGWKIPEDYPFKF